MARPDRGGLAQGERGEAGRWDPLTTRQSRPRWSAAGSRTRPTAGLQQIISQLDQLTLANRNLMGPLAEALAALVGQPVAITGIAPDPQSGMLGAIQYVTPDGGQHTLTIDRAPTKPASGLVLPH
jgi:hypothetical protein